MISGNIWASALQTLLGYSAHAPVHTTVSCPHGPGSIFDRMRDAGGARDVIYATVGSAANDGTPCSISMLIRRGGDDQLVRNCRLYAASHWSPLQLLAQDRAWIVGPGDMLLPAKLPRASRRAKGESIAMNRWRRAVEKVAARTIPDALLEQDRASDTHTVPNDFAVAA